MSDRVKMSKSAKRRERMNKSAVSTATELCSNAAASTTCYDEGTEIASLNEDECYDEGTQGKFCG